MMEKKKADGQAVKYLSRREEQPASFLTACVELLSLDVLCGPTEAAVRKSGEIYD